MDLDNEELEATRKLHGLDKKSNIEEDIKTLEEIKDMFSLHCPECGGRMKSEYLDMEIDKLVYKCKKCGKEWV